MCKIWQDDDNLRRREFMAALGGAAAWPLAARAQKSAIPVIGYLNVGSPESDAPRLTGLRRGLNQTGYVEGRNFVIEYRWARETKPTDCQPWRLIWSNFKWP
jgi:putative ABC transport system substrate-binding protein